MLAQRSLPNPLRKDSSLVTWRNHVSRGACSDPPLVGFVGRPAKAESAGDEQGVGMGTELIQINHASAGRYCGGSEKTRAGSSCLLPQCQPHSDAVALSNRHRRRRDLRIAIFVCASEETAAMQQSRQPPYRSSNLGHRSGFSGRLNSESIQEAAGEACPWPQTREALELQMPLGRLTTRVATQGQFGGPCRS